MNSVFQNMPKVGIRPTIDGRRNGVRESLEDQTMGMAKAVAELIAATLRYPDGRPVECVIADTTIGGVSEAAACAEKFQRENVGLSITVTPCWCYGSETMDMDPLIPKAIWGFNGTERPGAVYLAAVLAAHTQKGLPAFGIYGSEVKDASDRAIPDDVKDKILRFARAGLAVAIMRGRAYLSMGSVSMGIAGSIVNPDFFEKYLGMRCESVDMSEFQRRLTLSIYDPVEYEKALAWVKANCQEGLDPNAPDKRSSAARKAAEWETVVKMCLIGRDLMVGNPRLAALGYVEESCGHHAIAAGFQGQRQWTDFMPNGDFMETMLNTSFDWNGARQPLVLATENDCLNGVGMLFGYLLTARSQIFSDVRSYWSASAIERVGGWKPEGAAAGGLIHLINSGATCLDGSGEMVVDNKPGIKPFWEVSDEDQKRCLEATRFCQADLGYFPWRRLFHRLHHARRHAGHHDAPQSRRRPRPGAADRRRRDGDAAREGARHARPAHQPDLADDLVRAPSHRQGGFHLGLRRHGRLGRQPRRHLVRPHRRRPDHPGVDAADSRGHAQRRQRRGFPAVELVDVRHGAGRRRLPRLRQLRPHLPLRPSITMRSPATVAGGPSTGSGSNRSSSRCDGERDKEAARLGSYNMFLKPHIVRTNRMSDRWLRPKHDHHRR